MTFGELQADELQRFGYPSAHQIVVDAYMAQHPGDGTNRRDRQSVFVHLVGLCAVLEAGLDGARATEIRRRVVKQHDFPVLQRGRGPGDITLLSLIGARDLPDYEQRGRAWAGAVWQSWTEHHPLIRGALGEATGRAERRA